MEKPATPAGRVMLALKVLSACCRLEATPISPVHVKILKACLEDDDDMPTDQIAREVIQLELRRMKSAHESTI